MVTPASFRADFPEFSDTNLYSDGTLTFWINLSAALVNADRWTDLTDMAVELATAHQVLLANANQAAAAGGQQPGATKGLVSSKSVGDVSVSYDLSSATLTDGAFWNLTQYGVRFLQLARMFGSGPIQL
ncbi:MAG TPA: DUF4054 domain-containing protein [Bryobacteraceae bacterium]|jgi:hypothetical protein|nr:DUF4054 domain-containing protein [Bryobacteraceae bacterium]